MQVCSKEEGTRGDGRATGGGRKKVRTRRTREVAPDVVPERLEAFRGPDARNLRFPFHRTPLCLLKRRSNIPSMGRIRTFGVFSVVCGFANGVIGGRTRAHLHVRRCYHGGNPRQLRLAVATAGQQRPRPNRRRHCRCGAPSAGPRGICPCCLSATPATDGRVERPCLLWGV